MTYRNYSHCLTEMDKEGEAAGVDEENANKREEKKKKSDNEVSKSYWYDEAIKLFFIGLKSYGKDYEKIHTLIVEQDPKFDKNLKALRFFFHRILLRASQCIRRYIDNNIKKLAPADIERISAMIRTQKPRSQSANLNVVLAYGELYIAGLIPLRLKTKHFRKLYELLSTGSISYVKNRRKYILSVPKLIRPSVENAEFASSDDNETVYPVIANGDRLSLDIRPRTMAVLLLMKQRAFAPTVKLEIPVSCKISDVVDRLINYWRFPHNVNSLLFYHLNETLDDKNNKISTVRLLLEAEYFLDLRGRGGGSEIKILYELNYENTPIFSSSVLTTLTLNMIPKLAKTYLDLDESVHTFKKPMRPSLKLQPRMVVKEPQGTHNVDVKQTLPAKIRIKKPKPIEPIDPNKKNKRRVKTLSVATNNNQPTQNIVSSLDRIASSDFDFKLFGSNAPSTNKIPHNFREVSFDDPTNNDSRFTIPFEQSNFDPFAPIEHKTTSHMDHSNSRNQTNNQFFCQNTNLTTNDESNLGFLAHFGFYNQKDTLLSTPINPHFHPDLNEDSHPPNNYIAPEIMETPKFEKLDHKENKTPANVGRKLFFDVNE